MSEPPTYNETGTKYFKPKTNLEFFEYNLKKGLGNSRVLAKFNNYFQSVAQKRVSIQHPKAASEDEIREWIILNSKKSPTKIIWLLQYSEKLYKESEFISKKRNQLLEGLKNNNVEFIDTYSILKNQISKNNNQIEIWDGHHTKYGNEVVCKSIYEFLSKNM